MTEPPILECISLSKTYPQVRALQQVSMTVRRGEIRALLGKNGAGKSTLVKLIAGIERPDDNGKMLLDGKEVSWANTHEAQKGGVAVVHQEFSLVPELSIAENITLGRWPKKQGRIDRKEMYSLAGQATSRMKLDLPLSTPVSRLSTAQQQLVEISKALLDQPQVLILDEPTSALNTTEVDRLLTLVKSLAAEGVAIIYVSHRMREIPIVADTLTVLRDGKEVATHRVDEVTTDEVAALISGSSTATPSAGIFANRGNIDGPEVLAIENLSIPDILEDISIQLHKGEVLGLAGLLGSGRTELLQSVFGLRKDSIGKVIVNGKAMTKRNPRTMLDAGVAYTSEDRKAAGIIPLLGVGENLMLSARKRVLPGPFIKKKDEARVINDMIAKLRIATAGGQQAIGTLSGGNQQKGVIGRCLAGQMKILLLDEPTRGVDIDAKRQIYALIRELASQGVSSIFVSSELEELAQVCDRVLVIRDGRICEEINGTEATSERLLARAMQGTESNQND
ncbi:sugar ABC transporter ATP-binding protein [Schaalia vaccimaxillae]|uniref:sugar ABC transporter ATP-binding protein n=1 Tax=Schaalia vaccimaxillae TaxID=183916 RepID=UPI0003B4093C|nr:sugar ABC transporter ATP-binding protein [Schaalia vaccimaxillae]